MLFCWLGLTVYLILRSIYVDMTIDESASALFAIDSKTYLQVYQWLGLSANNHFLNTVLIKFFTSVFGTNQFFIRLPNILAYCLYAYYSFRILELSSKSTLVLITGFLLLNFSPYLLDWFSTARGYGLSYAFMMGSVYYLLLYSRDVKFRYLCFTMIFSSLSVLSVFSMLNFFSAVLLLLALLIVINLKKTGWRKGLIHFGTVVIFSALLALLIFKPILELKAANQFYFGGDNGYWKDTIVSACRHFLYNRWHINHEQIAWILLILVLTAFLTKVYASIRYRDFDLKELLLPLCLIFIPPLISGVQHYLLGTLYLTQRTAFFLFILALLSLILVLDSLVRYQKIRVFSHITLIILSIFMSIHFIKSSNTRSIIEWSSDQDNRAALFALKNYSSDMGISPPVKFYTTNMHFYSIDYYNRYEPFSFLFSPDMTDSINKGGLYYINKERLNEVHSGRITIIRSFPLSGMIILKYTP